MQDQSSELPKVRLLPLGDTAWTVEFGDRIDPGLHGKVLGLVDALAEAGGRGDLVGIVDVVPTFRSLTVHYDPLSCDGEWLGRSLLSLAQSVKPVSRAGRHWCIPAT